MQIPKLFQNKISLLQHQTGNFNVFNNHPPNKFNYKCFLFALVTLSDSPIIHYEVKIISTIFEILNLYK